MDRRATFFFAAAVICLVMSFVIEAELRYVPYWLAAVYLVLGVLSSLDAISRRRSRRTQ
jgi:hypothetical protein